MADQQPKPPPRRGKALPYNWGSNNGGYGNGFRKSGRSRSLRRLRGDTKRVSLKKKLLELVGRRT